MVQLSTFYRQLIEKTLKSAKVEPDTIDIKSEWDSSLTYQENKRHFTQKFNLEFEVKKATVGKKEVKEEKERQELEQIKKEEKRITVLQKEALKKIKKSPPNINRFFTTPRALINSFLSPKNDIFGFLFQSEPGLGKSYQVHDIFKEKKWKQDSNYAILSGYLTPMKLYAFLYINRNTKAILFDDIAKMFSEDTSRGLLLSALWSITGRRIVHYLSTSEKLVDDDGQKIPSSFELKAKIIWCMNRLPSELENIKSRCYFYELKFAHKTKIRIITEICKSEKIPLVIADYIAEHTNEAYNVDFRLPLKLFGLYKTNPQNWEDLARAILKPNEELVLITQLLGKHITVTDAIADYIKETGHSRATFFRKKKLLIQNIFIEDSAFVGSNPTARKDLGLNPKNKVRKVGKVRKVRKVKVSKSQKSQR